MSERRARVGKHRSSWTCRSLTAYLAAKGHALVSSETVRRHLHRLAYRVIRPVLSVSSPDPDYERKRRRVERAKRRARRGELHLLFEDEVDLHLLPGITGCWTRRGTQRKVETPRRNQKRYGFGAVNYVTGELTQRIEMRKTGAGFAALVEQVVARYCGKRWHKGKQKVALVIDNFRIHNCKRAAEVLARYRDQVEIISLPTYAPELNVIERVWKHLRRRVTHNHLFTLIEKMVAAVNEFFVHLDRRPREVLSVIGSTG